MVIFRYLNNILHVLYFCLGVSSEAGNSPEAPSCHRVKMRPIEGAQESARVRDGATVNQDRLAAAGVGAGHQDQDGHDHQVLTPDFCHTDSLCKE